MSKKSLLQLTLLFCLLLTGCQEEEVVYEPPPISEQLDSQSLDDITVNAFGPTCGFVLNSDSLQIHPYFNDSRHILVKKIIKSERDFWNILTESQSDEYVTTVTENYTLITTPQGKTYGYLPHDETWSILVESCDLNSGYVRLIMNQLCQQDS